MTRAQAFAEVLAVLRKTFADPDLVVTEATTALDVEGWDSLMHANLLVRLEKRFNTRIPDDVAYDLRDVGQLVDALWQRTEP
jgi:acyl carrier protein